MTSGRPRLRDRFLPPLVSALGPSIIRTLGATWKVKRVGLDPFVERSAGRSTARFIIALWHNTLFPLAFLHRDEHATVLVSQHGDGELIVRALHGLGFQTARGSTTRGGARALRELLTIARRGAGELAITPDGPKGPALVAQQGVAFLAAATGFPILPLALAASSAWRFRSWDRFQVPRPFARVAAVAGAPIEVPRDAIDADLSPYLRRYEGEMQRALEQAERLVADGW